MNGLRRALLAIGVLALALGIAAIPVTLQSNHASPRGLTLASALVVGWSFAFTGLVTWSRRPENRVGALMTWVGLTWLLSAMTASNDGYVAAFATLIAALPYGFLVLMLISFPDGRLHTRFERVLVAAVWFDTTVLQVLPTLLWEFKRGYDCPQCPSNPLLVSNHYDVAHALHSSQAALAVVLVGAMIYALVQRRRGFAPAQATALSPVLWTGAVALGVLALAFAALLSGVHHGGVGVAFNLGLIPLAAVPYAFLFGLVRTRFSRAGAVSELIERLGERTDRRRGLRDALANAFGDPTLRLAYWLPDRRRYVDADGHRIEPADGSAWTPIERNGAPLAAIIHDASLANEGQLLRTAGAAAGLALENERLEAELRARVDELQRSRERLIEVGLAERRSLERNLHDGAQQRLVALALSLRLARDRIADDPAGARELLAEAMVELESATSELRELARGIHPAVLSDRGLPAAIRTLTGRAPVPVEVLEAPDERLPAPVEAVAYYVVAEALTNIAKYAQASRVDVRVRRENGHVTVQVYDDGVGGADPRHGSGLTGLADRLAALDGGLEVDSPPGGGTTLTAQIPCA